LQVYKKYASKALLLRGEMRTFSGWLLGLKLGFIAVCLVICFDGHHPPAVAQQRQLIPVITAEDAAQDSEIAAISKHLEATDARVEKQWDALSANANELSGMRGEERIIGAVLGLLASSSLAVQLRKRNEI
jgi:hypothetical protein